MGGVWCIGHSGNILIVGFSWHVTGSRSRTPSSASAIHRIAKAAFSIEEKVAKHPYPNCTVYFMITPWGFPLFR